MSNPLLTIGFWIATLLLRWIILKRTSTKNSWALGTYLTVSDTRAIVYFLLLITLKLGVVQLDLSYCLCLVCIVLFISSAYLVYLTLFLPVYLPCLLFYRTGSQLAQPQPSIYFYRGEVVNYSAIGDANLLLFLILKLFLKTIL